MLEFLKPLFGVHQEGRSRPYHAHRRGRVQQLRRGALVVPDVGEVIFAKRCLYEAPADLTLKLFKTNVTPAEGDTHASYTVADFTNYVDKTLTATQAAGTWAVPTTTAGTTSSAYGGGTPLTWTCGATGNTIYGYWWQNATPTLMLAEAFATARVLASTDVLNLTPNFQAA